MRLIVDSHEDIAWNVLTFGRDPSRSVVETRALEAGKPTQQGEALLGYPENVRGGVAVVFATLHALPERRKLHDWEKLTYASTEEAHRVVWPQTEVYQRLVDEHPDKFSLLLTGSDLESALRTWQAPPTAPPRVGLVLLIEGADCVRTPGELEEWYRAGVRMVGPSWAGTRYAGGTREPGPLTAEGFKLLETMAELGIMLDLSHMAEQAFLQSLDSFPGIVLASHSNVRSLLDGSPIPDRHLSDEMIRGIVGRGGVIGVVPYNRFLKGGWKPEEGRQVVPLERLIRHIDHICQLAGDALHVGIGSDFDGGFGLDKIPAGLDSVADLRFIDDALDGAGYSPADVEAILAGNWLRLLRQGLPET